MSIIAALIATLKQDHSVREVQVGAHWTAVWTQHLGLASTLKDECPGHPVQPVADAGRLTEKTALELCRLAHSDSLLEASIGMATINSMLPEADGDALNAERLIIQKGAGKRIAVIGHFPFIGRLRKQVEDLWVLEKRPRSGDLPAEDMDRILPMADVVAISATTLINHTLADILSTCREDSFRIMLGASTPLSPVLFDSGLNALCGIQVTDPDVVLRHAQEGAIFRQIKGVKLVCMKR